LLALGQAVPAAAQQTPAYKIVPVPATLGMHFIPTDNPSLINGWAAIAFPEVENATFYEAFYTHVASGAPGYEAHGAHPGTRDKFILSSSFGTGEVIAPAGVHWVGLAGAFFADEAAGIKWTNDNYANVSAHALVPNALFDLTVSTPGADNPNFNFADFTAPDEGVEVRVTIQAQHGNVGTMTNVQWTPFTVEPADAVEILSGPTPPSIPQNFNLAPGARYIRSYVIRPLRPGSVKLSTRATGKSASGLTITPPPSELDLHFEMKLLDVEVEVDKPLVELEETPSGPVPQDVIATVTVTNVFDEPISNVVLDSLDPGSLIAPPPAVGALTVKAGPFDPAGPNPNPANLGTLDPGESAVRTYTLEANDDGHYEVVAFVTSDDPFGGTGLVEVGRAQVKMSGDVVLYFDTDVTTVIDRNGSDWVLGGNSWRVVGTLENRSSEDSVLVILQPQLTGNAFYAQPIPAGTAPPDSTCALGIARLLEPREKIQFTAQVRTLTDGGTRGTVKFVPRGFIVDENQNRTPLTADQVYFTEGSTEHTVRVDVSTDPPVDASVGELVGHLLVGTVDGLGRFAEGIVGLIGMAAHVIKFGWSPWDWPEAYRSAGDKVAKYLIDIRAGLSPADKALYDENLVAAAALAIGSTLEEARDLVDTAVEARFEQLTTAYETGDSREVANWFGELAGENPDLVLEALVAGYGICKLAHRGALTVRRGLVGFAESQAATLEARAAQGARALRAGDLLQYDNHLAPIFGIDKLSHRLLQDLAEKWNIMIAVRRRGAGVVQKLQTGRYTLKPFPIKAKNVSPIDIDWLGFPQNRLDEVMIKEPPPWLEVETKMKATFQDPERIAEVHERWKTRWKEWFGKNADPVTGAGGDLKKSERSAWQSYEGKGITLPGDMVLGVADNVVNGKSIPTDGRLTVLRNFRSVLAAAPDGRPALLANIEDPLKGWQGVTGDIDPMAFLRPDGTILPEDARLKLYQAMQHLGFQHPESITWTNEAGRAEYLQEFSVHNPTSESMALYKPDGTVVASRFDPGKGYIDPLNAKRAAQMYLRGGTTNIRSDPPTPVDMSAYEDLVDARPTVYVGPSTWAIINPNCPGNLTIAGATAGVCPLRVEYSSDPDALVLRQSSLGVLERWTPAGGWRKYVPSGSDVYVLPQTALAADASAGTTVLQVHDLEALGLDPGANDWFESGQVIVINPGGENEETAIVDRLGSIVLEEPLQFDHFEGETVSVVGELSTSTTLPVTTTTLSDNEPPARPVVLSLTPDATRPLTLFELEMSAMDDLEDGAVPSGLTVVIGGTLDDGSQGTIYVGEIPVEAPQRLRLPLALLDPATDYTLIASYEDSNGLNSEFSLPFEFATVAIDPWDLDADGVEDRAMLEGDFDLNGNSIDDATERIAVFADGELGDPLGLFSNRGTVHHVATLSELEALGLADSTPAPSQLPVGMVGYRVGGFAQGQTVAATLYLDAGALGVDQMLQLDANVGFSDATSAADFFPKFVTSTRIDGEPGDLDGAVNGRIVDTCGPGSGFLDGVACGAPRTGSLVRPTAADCLFILRAAVALETCSPACICAPKGALPASATDASRCLKAAVGTPGVVLDCPCD
jgi:hypothetical protein